MKRAKRKYWLLFTIFALFTSLFSVQAKDTKSLMVKPVQLSVLDNASYQVKSKNNLKLAAYLPKNISVDNKKIHWEIFKKDELIKKLKGKQHSLELPSGLYHVRLQIGQYHIQKAIQVNKGYFIQPYFPAKIGRLKLSSNHKVDWIIRDTNNQAFTRTSSMSFNEIVPAGLYNVQLQLHNLPKHQSVQVKVGQQVIKKLNVPVGEVSLIALKNDQPLFHHMQWNIFRLHSGKRHHINSYYLHSKRISLPPGLYEAVAIFKGKQQTRQFWVQKDTQNKVILAMD